MLSSYACFTNINILTAAELENIGSMKFGDILVQQSLDIFIANIVLLPGP